MTDTQTETTHIGNITVTRITPLSPDFVRFALTAKIDGGADTFTQPVLGMYALLLLTKTERKSKALLEEYQKRYGITLAVTAGIESISFTGSVRSEHVSKLTALLTELIFEPAITALEFKAKQRLMLEANREAHDNAKRIAHIHFVNTLYNGEKRLMLDTLHEEHTHIKKLLPKKLQALHTALPKATWYLSVVGDTTAEYGFMPLLRLLESTGRALSRRKIQVHQAKGVEHFTTVASKTNIEVQLGNIVPISSDDPTFVALDFGIDVLGKVGAFAGRLMSTVREKEGLTYGIYAHTQPHHLGDSFHFVIRTFFMAKDYRKGIASTMRELRSILDKGITERELRIFKEINRNEYILAHESNGSRLSLYHGLIVRGHSEYSIRDFHARVETLTRKEVNAALRSNIDPKKLILSAAGPITKEGTPIIATQHT